MFIRTPSILCKQPIQNRGKSDAEGRLQLKSRIPDFILLLVKETSCSHRVYVIDQLIMKISNAVFTYKI